jgi:hypothetical protein
MVKVARTKFARKVGCHKEIGLLVENAPQIRAIAPGRDSNPRS